MASQEKVDKIYAKYVKPLALAPRLGGGVKKHLLSIDGDSSALKGAIAPYLASRGYDASGKKLAEKPSKPSEKPSKEEKPSKPSKPSKEEKPSKPSKEEKPSKPSKEEKPSKDPAAAAAAGTKALRKDGSIDLSKLSREALVGMAKDLGVSKTKKLTDEELRSVVAKKATNTDETTAKLVASADPAKVDNLSTCLGVLLDLTNAACIPCPTQADCRRLFEENRKNGFPQLIQLQKEEPKPKAPEPVKATTAILVSDSVTASATTVVDGKSVDNSAHKRFMKRLLKKKPSTMGAFKKIVLKLYTPDDGANPDQLVSWFVRYAIARGALTFKK